MVWAPQPGPQTEAISADWCAELLYGGAAGGGKSDFLLGDYLQDVPTYKQAWRGVLFRRTYPELEELVTRSMEIYPQTGGEWSEQKRTWSWSNGAQLKLRYLESDRDVLRYQGHQYTWIGWDELTQWSSLYPYRYLKSRLRSAHPVPNKRIRAACNPGGPGHQDVKAYFVDPAPGGFAVIRELGTGAERMFIPAKLRDNFILMSADPGYADRLRGVGSESLVRALLNGDWSVIEGAFFTEWDEARHMLRPFAIPDGWTKFRSLDWGYAAPSSVGWWAVVSDPYRTPEGITLPRGCLVRYREFYAATGPNKGLRWTAEQLGAQIKTLTGDEKIAYTVADPAIFAEDGGPAISERLGRCGVHCRPADNSRSGSRGHMGGWDQMRARMRGDGDGHPMLVVFSTCKDFVRTVPALQHDRAKVEDLDTTGEDHVADETRYACMSRPYAATVRTAQTSARSGYASPGPSGGGDSWRTV